MKLFRLSLLFTALLPMVATADEVKLPQKKDFHLFLLAGQSNMAGRGKVDAKAHEADPRILAINKQNEWQVAMDPLHWDKTAAGTGIGKPFAEMITSKDRGITVGLIPSACGGSPISTWQPGEYWTQTKSHPWDDSIERAKRAMKDGTLKAILWHQGESDSNAKKAATYEKNLEDLIHRFRKELDDPDLPFIIGQLGRFPAKPWNEHREAVDAAQRAVAAKMKNVRFVEIPNPESIGDDLHFDTPTLRRFAQVYAAAYLDITGGKP
jgi:hypothetical protein